MQKNLTINMKLTTMSPLTIVTPDAREVDGCRQTFRRTVYRDGIRMVLPGIPGSTLRGRLRRSVTEITRRLAERKFTLDEWHQNAVGGIKGAGSESAHDMVGRQLVRAKNPVMALFGAGSPWMHGAVSMSDALPHDEIACDRISGVRSDDGHRNQDFFAKLSPDAPDAWLKLRGENRERTEMKAQLADLKKASAKAFKSGDVEGSTMIKAEIIEMQRAMKDSDAGKTNPVSMPLKHEALPAGVELHATIRVSRVTDDEIWALLAGLDHMWREDPHLGQKRSLGYGLVDGVAEYIVSEAPVEIFSGEPAPLETGSFRLQAGSGLVDDDGAMSRMTSEFFDRKSYLDWDLRMASTILKEKEAQKKEARKATSKGKEAAE